MEVVKYLIQCDWCMGSQQQQSPQTQQQASFTKSHAVQQALIAAASMGYTEVRQGGRRSHGLSIMLTGVFNSDTDNDTFAFYCFSF